MNAYIVMFQNPEAVKIRYVQKGIKVKKRVKHTVAKKKQIAIF